MTAYLLHDMPEEERWTLSEQWLSDADFHEELRVVEAELLDEYVRGGGSARRHAQVAEWLLTGDRQNAKLQFASALHRRFRNRRPKRYWLPAAIAVAAAVLLIFAWDASRPKATPKPTEVATTLPAKRNVFAVHLVENDLRGAEQRNAPIAIPQGTDLVRLDLDLDPSDENPATSVEVTGPGAMAWREADVVEARQAGRAVASVWLPASMLNSGDYEVKLLVKGKPIAYYRMTFSSK